MPKLENFESRVEIDGLSYRKNEIKAHVENNGSITIRYSMEADKMQRAVEKLTQTAFGDWTDKNDKAYASLLDLTSDFDSFLFSETASNTEVLKGSEKQLEDISRNIERLIVEQKITNKILSEAFNQPLYEEKDLDI